MKELANYIQNTFEVKAHELDMIVLKFEVQEVEKGHYWLETGQVCRKLAFVNQGMMRIYVNLDGREVTQWISTPGYFITDLSSFLFRTPARWTIQALNNCKIFSIDQEAYQHLGKELPNWHQIEKLFIARCFGILEDRIFSHLSMSAEERYQLMFDKQPQLFNQVPLQYLASMLGMTPETLSRIRAKM